MSNQLMDTLESKVFSAVDKIESLQTEINELRDERQTLEDKLRELIGKMEQLEGNGSATAEEETSEDSGDDPTPSFRPNY